MRDEYLKEAQAIISDPNALINVVSRRSKQLKFGNKPLVESLEKLEPEDIALREIIEGKISYQEWDESESDDWRPLGVPPKTLSSFSVLGLTTPWSCLPRKNPATPCRP